MVSSSPMESPCMGPLTPCSQGSKSSVISSVMRACSTRRSAHSSKLPCHTTQNNVYRLQAACRASRGNETRIALVCPVRIPFPLSTVLSDWRQRTSIRSNMVSLLCALTCPRRQTKKRLDDTYNQLTTTTFPQVQRCQYKRNQIVCGGIQCSTAHDMEHTWRWF